MHDMICLQALLTQEIFWPLISTTIAKAHVFAHLADVNIRNNIKLPHVNNLLVTGLDLQNTIPTLCFIAEPHL